MNKLKLWFARFMYGRYGTDQLYSFLFGVELFLLFASAVLNLLGHSADIWATVSLAVSLLSYALLIYIIFRCFSRNISARRRENQRYLRIRQRVWPTKAQRVQRPYDTATHVFRNCPKCGAVLRLPRTAGKHTAVCPRCDRRFTVRVKAVK